MRIVSNILSVLGKAALFALIVATLALVARVQPAKQHASGELDSATQNLAKLPASTQAPVSVGWL